MKSQRRLSHVDESGGATMVDVGEKPVQARTATAIGHLECAPATIKLLRRAALPKGDVLTVAKIAAIQGAKATSSLIPLCHPLPLNHVDVEFTVKPRRIEIRATARTQGKTGVEMEALTAVSIAALTLYDMIKAVDKTMVIGGIQVVEKIKQ